MKALLTFQTLRAGEVGKGADIIALLSSVGLIIFDGSFSHFRL